MSIRTKEQLMQDFETLADGSIPGAVVAASERIQLHLVALEEEHRAALSRARAGALEDASEALGGASDMARSLGRKERSEAFRDGATLVLSLKEDATPATASIPVERVREAVQKARGASWLKMGAEAVASDLGIEMEGAQ